MQDCNTTRGTDSCDRPGADPIDNTICEMIKRRGAEHCIDVMGRHLVHASANVAACEILQLLPRLKPDSSEF